MRRSVRGGFLSARVAIAPGLALAAAVALGGCRSADRADPGATVSPAVLEAVRAQGRAEVLVALEPPAGYEEGGTQDAALRAAIASTQDDVLESVGVEFRLRHRFTAVPALAGTVLTERGVALLSGHPRVVRVDLDEGGGGSGGASGRGTGGSHLTGESP